jgi:putative aldouronate transport system substrate-binding protein
MKMARKVLAILLAACVILTFAACGSANQNPSSTTQPAASEAAAQPAAEKDAETGLTPMADRDPITFKIFLRDPNTAPSKDNPILKKITELTGVTIEYEFLVGDLQQKQGVMIAGEDYPDAIFAESAKFIDAGAFIPLEDKLPNYPNLNAHYSPNKDKMTAPDGHEYILELFSVYKNIPPIFQDTGVGFFIQKAVLEAGGNQIPKTLDEYFKLIEDYKAKNPTIDGVKTIGFEVLCDGWRDFCLRNPAQHLMGAGNDGDVFVDQSSYTASLYQISDTAKAYYKKLNEEYHKGIIEAETFTENYDQYISRLSTGAVLGMFDQQWNFASGENVLKSDNKYNRTYVAVPITNPGVKDGYLDAPTFTGNNGLGITKKCQNPDRLLAFYDWLLQEDVQNYLNWGVEGKDYTKVGETGKVWTKEYRDIRNDDAKRRDLTGYILANYSPKRQGLYDDGSPCTNQDSVDEYKASLSEYDLNFLKAFNIDYHAQILSAPVVRPKYYPVWAFSIEDGSEAKTANTKFNDVSRKYLPRLIMSKSADYDALWDKYVAEFNTSNPQAYLDEVNRQIKAKMGK